MKKETLYIAYGSNLNLPQMAFRCPTAKAVGVSEIEGYELLFRGSRKSAVATVEPLEGSSVPVLLWKLKECDQEALDRYEGYPHFYRKEFLPVEIGKKSINAMVYIMNDGYPFGTPSDHYLNTIMEGYRSAGFNTEFLEQSVEKSIGLAREQSEAEPEQGSLFGQRWW